MSLLNGTQHIIRTGQHFEVVDEHGRFLCSGDTIHECENELVKMIRIECMKGAVLSA